MDDDRLVATVAGSRHDHLLKGVNLAFIAAWCDARQWPDVAFVSRGSSRGSRSSATYRTRGFSDHMRPPHSARIHYATG